MTQNTQTTLCLLLSIISYIKNLAYDEKYTNNFVFIIINLVIHKQYCYDTKIIINLNLNRHDK